MERQRSIVQVKEQGKIHKINKKKQENHLEKETQSNNSKDPKS